MTKPLLLTLCMLLAVNCMAPQYSLAEPCTVQCPVTQDNAWGYMQADKFQWTDPQDQVHMLIGFSGSILVGELVHHYTKLPVWQSALIGTLVMGLVGTTKEVLFDTYTSRTDIKAYWAGSLVGGLTVMVIHF